MTSGPDLYQRFIALMNEPITSESSDNPEVISTLYQNDWIRILVVRDVDNPKITTIEVESSLPLRIKGEPKEVDDVIRTRELLEGMIKALKYLLRLQDTGFSLDIIGQDCMWTAYMEFDALPDQDIFQLLHP